MSELQQIPGIGTSIAKDLIDIGINSVADLKNKNPEYLYSLLEEQNGKTDNIW